MDARSAVDMLSSGLLSTVTTEPVLVLNAIANGVKFGAGILDKLLFDKVCLYKLDYPEHVCANLTEYETENYAVQEVRFSQKSVVSANLSSCCRWSTSSTCTSR